MKTQIKNKSFISGKERLGSATNWIIGNNNTEPKVGEGATELLWSDRHAYDVTFVSKDGKQCKIRPCISTRTDANGYFTESQDYKYTPDLNAKEELLVYRNGSWRREVKQILFTDEMCRVSYEERKQYYNEEHELTKVIEGITFMKKSYPKINIIFGRRDEYRDPSF